MYNIASLVLLQARQADAAKKEAVEKKRKEEGRQREEEARKLDAMENAGALGEIITESPEVSLSLTVYS